MISLKVIGIVELNIPYVFRYQILYYLASFVQHCQTMYRLQKPKGHRYMHPRLVYCVLWFPTYQKCPRLLIFLTQRETDQSIDNRKWPLLHIVQWSLASNISALALVVIVGSIAAQCACGTSAYERYGGYMVNMTFYSERACADGRVV